MTLTLQEIPLEQICPSPHNPRIFRDRDPELASLADSIRSVGVLHPVLVRPVHGVNGDGAAYELIAGERRWRAAKLAGVAVIPATVRSDLDDQQALELTVTENLQREDLHPLEEARGVASLLGEGHDYRAVADRLGKSLGWVARRARIAKLSKTWLKLATDANSQISKWPATHLELVARLEPKAQDAFYQQYQWLREEDAHESLLSAHELQRYLADWTRELRLAPWKLDDATIDPQAGACAECPKRSSCTPGLFDDDAEADSKPGDRCLDATCWDRKLDRHLERKLLELEGKHGKVVLGGYLQHGEKLPAFVTKRQPKLVDTWDGRHAKKGEKGAVPLLVVAGRDRGKVEWRVFGKDAAKAAREASANGEQPKPATLAERRKKLEARRQAHALGAICTAVEGSPTPPVEEVVAIAAAFGTSFNAMQPGRIHDGAKLVDPSSLLAKPSALGRLWCAVAEVLSKRWQKTHAWNGLKGIEQCRPEIEEIARRIGLDLAPFAAAAAAAIPEPKSWANLTASGTPKAAKAKPAKKAAGKLAAEGFAPVTKPKARTEKKGAKASEPNTCLSCGTELPAGALTCSRCDVQPDPEQIALDSELRANGQCPACGGPLKKNAAYCGKCGIDPNAHPTTHHTTEDVA